MIFEKTPRERGASVRRSQGESASGRGNSTCRAEGKKQLGVRGGFWELTTDSLMGVW